MIRCYHFVSERALREQERRILRACRCIERARELIRKLSPRFHGKRARAYWMKELRYWKAVLRRLLVQE